MRINSTFDAEASMVPLLLKHTCQTSSVWASITCSITGRSAGRVRRRIEGVYECTREDEIGHDGIMVLVDKLTKHCQSCKLAVDTYNFQGTYSTP
jgi:hypothetical protein